MPTNKTKGDIYWYARKRKKPVAYSTAATELSICLLAEDGKTFKQIRDLFTNGQIIFDPEAVAVLDALIKCGDGDLIARDRLNMR